MSSARLAFSSDGVRSLSMLETGRRGVIVGIGRPGSHDGQRMDRLLALGVTPGAKVTMLQAFPGIVFLCDQTELAVERTVADAILIKPDGDTP